MSSDTEPHHLASLPTNGFEGSATPSRVCVIDLGTNSFHALIVDIFPNGTFSIVDRIKEMVRLGEGSLIRHQLSESAMERGIRVLKRIRMLADGWGTGKYLAFATSAIREAENGGDFIIRIREELDLLVRPIDGSLEALLIYKAVRRSVDMPQPTLLLDIGGGSAEFIIGTNEEHFFLASMKLGAARLSDQYISTDPISEEEYKALQTLYRQELRPVFASARKHEVTRLVGSSGTMENLCAAVLQAHGIPGAHMYRREFTAADMRDMTGRIMSSTLEERKSIAGIDKRRLGQIVAGAALVDVVLNDLDIETVSMSPTALREGMVLHFIDQNFDSLQRLGSFSNVRRRSVYEMAYRFQFEEAHARHVAGMALQLFDDCAGLHGLGERERELLEFAAILHDIGNIISYSSHHKHAIYLIKQADLKGFSPREVSILANVARYHRKSMPKKSHSEFSRLEPEHQELVAKLSSFLRLANGLDRSHYQNVRSIHTDLDSERLRVIIETRGDPQLEIWAGRRSSDLFERTFKRRVEIAALVAQPA